MGIIKRFIITKYRSSHEFLIHFFFNWYANMLLEKVVMEKVDWVQVEDEGDRKLLNSTTQK